MIAFASPNSSPLALKGRQHVWKECLVIVFVSPQRAAGVLSRTLSSSPTIVEEALTAGVVKKMIKFLRVK